MQKAASIDDIMELEGVKAILGRLNKILYVDKSLRLIDFSLVVKIDLMRKVEQVLEETQDTSLLLKHCVNVTDGLLKGIWWMTNSLKQEAKKG